MAHPLLYIVLEICTGNLGCCNSRGRNWIWTLNILNGMIRRTMPQTASDVEHFKWNDLENKARICIWMLNILNGMIMRMMVESASECCYVLNRVFNILWWLHQAGFPASVNRVCVSHLILLRCLVSLLSLCSDFMWKFTSPVCVSFLFLFIAFQRADYKPGLRALLLN